MCIHKHIHKTCLMSGHWKLPIGKDKSITTFRVYDCIVESPRESPEKCQKEQNLVKVKVKVKSLSRVWLFETPWTVAHQAPPSMGFSRQEYWSGLPFPSPGDLPNPGIKPRDQTHVSRIAGRCFNLWATREALS